MSAPHWGQPRDSFVKLCRSAYTYTCSFRVTWTAESHCSFAPRGFRVHHPVEIGPDAVQRRLSAVRAVTQPEVGLAAEGCTSERAVKPTN